MLVCMWSLFCSVQVYISLYFLPLSICNFPLSLFNKNPFFVKLITKSYSILLILLLNLSLFLSAFSVFLNEYFFRWLACKSSQKVFGVNKLYYAILQHFFCIHLFPKFFRIEVFQQLGFSGSESRVWVHILEVAQRQCVYFLMLKKKKRENKTKFIS